jgi:hypothetical protein
MSQSLPPPLDELAVVVVPVDVPVVVVPVAVVVVPVEVPVVAVWLDELAAPPVPVVEDEAF